MNNSFWIIGIFLASLIISGELPAVSQQKHFLENQLSHLLLEEMSSLSFSERMWINKQNLTYTHLSSKVKHTFDAKDDLEKITRISQKLSSPPPGVPFFTRSAPNQVTGIQKKGRKHPSSLFSSNDVMSSSQWYIVSESPRKETLNTFWQTLFDNDVRLIITLVSPLEEGKKHLSLFWQKENFPLFVGDWKVDAIGEGVVERNPNDSKKQIISRLFLAHNSATKKTRVLQQLHYLNWPDMSRPEPKLLEHLISLAIQLNPDREKPLFVHCAAGIGRSGTFITAHSLCKEMWDAHSHFNLKKTPINIPEKLILFRMQRPCLVSNTGQYESIYQTVDCFVKRMKKERLL